MNVGVKQLRDQLSRHLSAVRDGHTITVTDHGRAVARIVPVAEPSPLERLVAEGLVMAPTEPRQPLPPPDVSASITDLVADQRG